MTYLRTGNRTERNSMNTSKQVLNLLFFLGLSLVYCACESPEQKSLADREWTEFGIYIVAIDQGIAAGVEVNSGTEINAGESSAADNMDKAGEEVSAGMPQGGSQVNAGEEFLAGEDLGGEMLAGEEVVRPIQEDPLVAFESASIPEVKQVALFDAGSANLLWWSNGNQLWQSQTDAQTGALLAPELSYEHSAEITRVLATQIGTQSCVIIEDEMEGVYLLYSSVDLESFDSAEQSTSELVVQSINLKPGLIFSRFEDRLLLVGTSIDSSLLTWFVITDNDLQQQSLDLDNVLYMHEAESLWPTPDSVAWISGQAVFRFDQVGQCLYLSSGFSIIGSAPCLAGSSHYLSSASSSILLLLDEAGTLKASIASAPNLEASYLIAQVDLEDNNTGRAQPQFGPMSASERRVSYLGRPISGSSADSGLDHLIILEPNGMWLSEDGWQQWPYDNVKAITRRGREAWLYVFDEEHQPRRVKIPLQIDSFKERTPYGLSKDPECRPTVERCDEVDNNCDGVIDNGICCATGRDPYEGYFIPSAPPREFFVTDVENSDASRYAIRVAEDRWEIWAIYYGASSRNMVSFGSIEGAYDALGFTAAGGYSVLVAKDAEGEWRAFWNHSNPDSAIKEPELLNCEQALAMSNVGNLATSSSPAVVCNDRVVHLRADRDENDALKPIESHESLFANLPDLEWATFIRHISRGESSFIMAFQSLAGQTWEVNKVSVAKGVGGRLNFGVPQSLNGRLNIDGIQRPSPIYLHRDDSPGFPGALPYLQIDETHREALLNIPNTAQRFWTPLIFGRVVDRIEYTELPSKVVASAIHDDGLGQDFYVVDMKGYERLSPWVTQPTLSWRSPKLLDQTPPQANETQAFLWSLIHGNYYNYLATMFEAGDQSIDGSDLPRGVWALRLYSITQCPQ